MPEIPGDWVAMARLVGLLFVGYFMVIWFTSVVWVYRDISSRTNDPISQLIAVLVAVVFPIVGLPVYFVLRPAETLQESYDRQLEQEAILSELHSISACPDCRRPISEDFMVCAYCGTQLKQPCVSCSQLMQFAWRHCPYCAAPQPRRQAPARRSEAREPAEQGARRSRQPQGEGRQSEERQADGRQGGARQGAARQAERTEGAGAAAAASTAASSTEGERRRATNAEATDESASAVATARPRRAPRPEDGATSQP